MKFYNKTVKYPKDQYERLVEVLRIIDNHLSIDLRDKHPADVWWLAYSQVSKSNKHNRLGYTDDNLGSYDRLCKQHQANGGFKPLMKSDDSIKIDIEGIKDSHRDTATKRALKEIYTY